MNDRYNEAKLSLIIWHFLPPYVKVLLSAALLIFSIILSAVFHVFLQLIWYLLLLFLFMINMEIYKDKISRRKYITINIILCLFLAITISSQVYTMRKYGSGDSVSAFAAIVSINLGTEDIVLSGTTGSVESYLANRELTQDDIELYFGKKEQRKLHVVDSTYDKGKYLCEGEMYVARYVLEDREEYQIIKYYNMME